MWKILAIDKNWSADPMNRYCCGTLLKYTTKGCEIQKDQQGSLQSSFPNKPSDSTIRGSLVQSCSTA